MSVERKTESEMSRKAGGGRESVVSVDCGAFIPPLLLDRSELSFHLFQAPPCIS